MNKILYFLSICLVSTFIACNSHENCCTILDTNFTIEYINENGETIFDSIHSYVPENIKLYFKNVSKYELAYDRNLDNPAYFTIDTTTQGTINIGILPSHYYKGNFSTTLIELNPNVVDTIRCEFDLSNSNAKFKNAYYNGIKKEGRFFQIIK